MSDFQNAVEREMHGRTVARLQDVNETAYQAGLILLSEIDPKETQRIAQIQVFDDVDEYVPPEDYKSMVDFLPSGGRQDGSEFESDFRRTGQREFSMRHAYDAPLFSEKWVLGVLIQRLRQLFALLSWRGFFL